MRDAELTHLIIGVAIGIHRNLRPSLLEAIYEECLAKEFTLKNISCERQKPIPLIYKDLKLECGCRLDFLMDERPFWRLNPLNRSLLFAIRSCRHISGSPRLIWDLVNFNVPILKDGIKRYVWHYEERDNTETQSGPEI